MANQGVAPPDFETAVGQVRLLIGDTDPKPGTEDAADGTGEYVFYSDDELTAMLSLFGGDARRAAVQVLRSIAGSQSLLLRKWSSADLAVDGPAITNALLNAAASIEGSIAVADRAADFAIVVPVGGRATETRGLRHPMDYVDRWARWNGIT